MKNQTYRMTMLLDFYGEILTQRQREFFDLYYNEDLSLAEIAENYDISRQGVRDAIVRAEAAMNELEDKTGLLKRFMRLREKIDSIESAAEDIRKLNYRQYENPELERLAGEILSCAAADDDLFVLILVLRFAGFDPDIAIFILSDGQIAVVHIIGTRKGRGCNGRNNRHDGCRRQHPQS